MMEMFTGNPFFLVATGGLLTAILMVMYFQTYDARLRPFLIAALGLTLLPILTDVLVTTDRESIRSSVNRLARSVRLNDLEGTLEFAHPASDSVYNKIKNEMPNYKFSYCSVAGFHYIHVDESTRDAIVKFTVFVNVDAKLGPQGIGNRGITLNMREDGPGQWKILDYQHYPPTKRNKQSEIRD